MYDEIIDIERWKERIEAVQENGIDASIREETEDLLAKPQSEQVRSLLFLAKLHDLNSDDRSAMFARFLWFLLDRDPRTLFLIATEAIANEDYAYTTMLCTFYLSEFSESENEIRLMKAFAEKKMGLIEACRSSLEGGPPDTSLWLGKDGLTSAASLT